jgi:excisionase family DNA binding protein
MSTLDVPINIGMVFEPLLTSRQAAPLVCLHYKTLERMARSGLVPATKQGKSWLFRASKLNTWINEALDSNASPRSKTAVRNDGIRTPEHVLTSGAIRHTACSQRSTDSRREVRHLTGSSS